MLFGLSAIGAYLLGSFNPAIWMSKRLFRQDIRSVGSHNPGTTNTLRTFGFFPALFVFLFDFCKAFIPVYLLVSETKNLWLAVFAALSILLGHCFSVFYGFHGGKGVACAFGAICALAPTVALLLLAVCAVLSVSVRHVFLSPVLTAGLMIPVLYIYAFVTGMHTMPLLVFSVGVFSVLYNRHLPQIHRAFSAKST